MNEAAAKDWHEANQHYLMAALVEVRQALERHAALTPRVEDDTITAEETRRLGDTSAAMPAPPALDRLCQMFNLSPFERQVLLLCAGMELDGSFAALCAAAQGDPARAYPTFGLALAALPQAHWSALSPAGPLRHWRLIEVDTRSSLTAGPLRIDERVLHYLTGVEHMDERLEGFFEPLKASGDLAPSHRALAKQLATTWSRTAGKGILPVVQLCGNESAGQRAIAALVCAELGLRLHVLPAQAIPGEPRERETLKRLWEREALLSDSALLIECGDVDPGDTARESTVARIVAGTQGALMISSRERRTSPHRPIITLEVGKPTTGEQRALWECTLGAAASGLDGQVDSLVTQFNLSVPTIHSVCTEALGRLDKDGDPTASSDDLGAALWNACRMQARPQLENLAQRIEAVATWEDLVLPPDQVRTLREIAAHVRQRGRVYEDWGFATKGSRGLGISALFAGASGTGKTMAAEVLANELQLDLFRIDLSQVVSKYIGETEKNLRRVFDAAEEGGAILLFDEADALFGKRSEVKDSHDRYANIEISYLLQRMEAYRGLAILTTNMKSALDSAFLRRIRFVVQFPFPDTAQRAEIWRRIFPTDTPTGELEVSKLARLNVAGGNIRNIALYAAFLAAEERAPVRMAHLLRAAQVEYGKLEKALTDAETSGWLRAKGHDALEV